MSQVRAPQPTAVTVHQHSRVLELVFDDGATFRLPFELLRVMSPSAEVRGHGVGQAVLQVGKREVGLTDIQPVGHYALKPSFDDGHDSGLYTWDYLYDLGAHQAEHWVRYEADLAAAGASREPGSGTAAAPKPARHGGGCGGGGCGGGGG